MDSIDDFAVGDPLKDWFKDRTLTLISTKYIPSPGSKPEKIKLNGLRLLGIEFLQVEMSNHCYKAKLYGLQKHAMDVILVWDGSGEDKPAIRLRSAQDEQPLTLAVDAANKVLTVQSPDVNKGLCRCASFYTRCD